jgi:hypothetical protein
VGGSVGGGERKSRLTGKTGDGRRETGDRVGRPSVADGGDLGHIRRRSGMYRTPDVGDGAPTYSDQGIPTLSVGNGTGAVLRSKEAPVECR